MGAVLSLLSPVVFGLGTLNPKLYSLAVGAATSSARAVEAVRSDSCRVAVDRKNAASTGEITAQTSYPLKHSVLKPAMSKDNDNE